MKKVINKFFLYIPLLLVEAYLAFTILLYQFGPLDWKTENETMFWLFLFAYHFAFIAGYILSVKKVKLNKSTCNISQFRPWVYRVFMWVIIGICVVCACIEYKNVTLADSYIPYELPGNFINGLLNPAEQYYSKSASADYTSNKLVTVLSAAFSFIYVSLIPLLVVEWKRISVPQKFFCFAIILFKVVVYVSVGTNKGIFDTMFNFVGILLILVLLNIFHNTDEHIDKKTFVKVSAFALFLVVFSFSYFTINISSRVESPVDYAMSIAGNETEPAATAPMSTEPAATAPMSTEPAATVPVSTEPTATVPVSTEPTATAPMSTEPAATVPASTAPTATVPAATETVSTEPEEKKPDSFLKRMYYSVSNYLTQGYYGMSLSLDEEFSSTYGIGNSQFLMSNFKSIFGIDVQDRTYQHKITEQWDEYGKWHSFYSYIANDVSFYGVIVVMLLIGMFYGCICKDVILNNSLIGKMLLPLFIVMFMYMPANNQIFTSMATCTAFLELSFLWIVSKINWNMGPKHGK